MENNTIHIVYLPGNERLESVLRQHELVSRISIRQAEYKTALEVQ